MRRHAIAELKPRWVSAGDLRYGVGIRMLCPLDHAGCQLMLLFWHPNDGMEKVDLEGAHHFHHTGGMMEELSIREVIHHRSGFVVVDKGRVYAWFSDC